MWAARSTVQSSLHRITEKCICSCKLLAWGRTDSLEWIFREAFGLPWGRAVTAYQQDQRPSWHLQPEREHCVGERQEDRMTSGTKTVPPLVAPERKYDQANGDVRHSPISGEQVRYEVHESRRLRITILFLVWILSRRRGIFQSVGRFWVSSHAEFGDGPDWIAESNWKPKNRLRQWPYVSTTDFFLEPRCLILESTLLSRPHAPASSRREIQPLSLWCRNPGWHKGAFLLRHNLTQGVYADSPVRYPLALMFPWVLTTTMSELTNRYSPFHKLRMFLIPLGLKPTPLTKVMTWLYPFGFSV